MLCWMTLLLKKYLSEDDAEIANIQTIHGADRWGDIPHSLASIEKAEDLMGYKPTHTLGNG